MPAIVDSKVVPTPEEAAANRVLVEGAKLHFSNFFSIFPPNSPYHHARHTRDMLAKIEAATERSAAGLRSHVIFTQPPRHGKSDITSMRLPVWWHLMRPHEDIIISANTYELAASRFSAAARDCCAEVCGTFGRKVGKGTWAEGEWAIEGAKGRVKAVGVGGQIMGRGGSLIVIDDPYIDRAQVESEVERQAVWDWFRSVISTRRAPNCAVIISMQRWHPDDIVGKIIAKNTPGSPDYDPEFPLFTVVKYQAHDPRPVEEGGNAFPGNEEGWLFPERYDAAYYREQRAMSGVYAWNSQYQQEPTAQFGNMFDVRVEGETSDPTVHFIDAPPPGFYERGWDLASSVQQLKKDDPDFTATVKAAVIDGWLVIADARQYRAQAGTRNADIIATAKEDGPSVRVRMEAVAGYVDAYTQVREALLGHISVVKTTPHHDKVSRGRILAPFFEAAKVKVVRGPWNEMWIKAMKDFPSGTHDDLLDATVLAVDDQIQKRTGQPAISTPVDSLRIKRPVFLTTDATGAIRKRFRDLPRTLDPTLEALYCPAGTLIRGTWLGRAEGSCSHLVFVDGDGGCHVIETVESNSESPRMTPSQFARAMLVSGYNFTPGNRGHFDLDLDLFSSDDDDDLQYEFEELLHIENRALGFPETYSIPVWIPPAEVDGKAGMDTIETLAARTAEGRGDGLYIQPNSTLMALRDARTRPQAAGREGRMGREDLDISSNTRALKLLFAKFRK